MLAFHASILALAIIALSTSANAMKNSGAGGSKPITLHTGPSTRRNVDARGSENGAQEGKSPHYEGQAGHPEGHIALIRVEDPKLHNAANKGMAYASYVGPMSPNSRKQAIKHQHKLNGIDTND